ncbi:peptidase inhibitor family I36 protein [Streptomyces sp. NPDC101490]|uniref:peptidase inhibitor family I36 protein n=1 Tax=unclassified Streptomyces TaxID=2593676 RepID=UPI0033278E0F
MKRVVTASIGAAAACLLAVAGMATPAGAAGEAQADDNKFWLFESADYHGGSRSFTASHPDLRDINWSGTTRPVHNGASAMKNWRNHAVWLYDSTNYSGLPGYKAVANSVDASLGSGEFPFPDKASSIEFR